jgi:hypothetical protein
MTSMGKGHIKVHNKGGSFGGHKHSSNARPPRPSRKSRGR